MANILHDLQSEDPQKDHSFDPSQDHRHDPSKDHMAKEPHINQDYERSLTNLRDHDNSQDLIAREPKDHRYGPSHDLSSASSGDLKHQEQPIYPDSGVFDIAKDHDSSAQELIAREPKDHRSGPSHDLSSASSDDLNYPDQPIYPDSSVSDIAKDHDSSSQDLSNKDTQRDHELELPDDPDFEFQANSIADKQPDYQSQDTEHHSKDLSLQTSSDLQDLKPSRILFQESVTEHLEKQVTQGFEEFNALNKALVNERVYADAASYDLGYIKSTIANNFPSHKINESAEVIIHPENGLLYLDSEDVIHEALSLCKQIGYLHKDILVTFEEHSDKIYIQYGEDKRRVCTMTLASILTPQAIKKFANQYFSWRYYKTNHTKLLCSLLTYVGNGFNSRGEAKVCGVFENNKQKISQRTVQRNLARDEFVELIRAYGSVLLQVIHHYSREYILNSSTGDEVVKELISQLGLIGISDIALYDGTTLEVNSSISREADVSGSGSHRSAKRSSSHKKSSSESRNYQVKIHAVYSLVSKCLMGATITPGTGAESRNFYTDFITFAGKKILAIADRGYHSLLLFARCMKQGVPFIIRLDSQCTYKIREAYTSDGLPLPQLVGMKVNYSEVTQLAAKYQSLELVVDAKSSIERAAIINGDEELFEPEIFNKNTKQPTLYCNGLRVVLMNRSEGNIPDKDRCMILATTLNKDQVCAETIYMLYKLRWGVESFFKNLKGFNRLQKTNARNINTNLSMYFASMISYQVKAFITTCAIPYAITQDTKLLQKALDDNCTAASAGITRRFNELAGAISHVYSRVNGTGTNIRHVTGALSTSRPFTNCYNKEENKIAMLEPWQLAYLREDGSEIFRELFACKPSMIKKMLAAAATGSQYELCIFKSLDCALNAIGINADVIGVLKQIERKSNKIGVPVQLAVQKPQTEPTISIMKCMGHPVTVQALEKIYSSSNNEESSLNIIDQCAQKLAKTCKTSKTALNVRERFRSSYTQVNKVTKNLMAQSGIYRISGYCPIKESPEREYLRGLRS